MHIFHGGCCYGCHWICNNGICCAVPDFEAKDNDLLTAMPIPPRYILLTRVITLLIVELAESLVLGIEAMLIYKIFAPVPVGGAIMMVVEIIGLNMITASISAIFGLVLAAITNRMRRKIL